MNDLSPQMAQTLFRGLSVTRIVPLTDYECNRAIRLQRQGLTLSEIAAVLDCDQRAIERYLYWDIAGDRRE